MKQASIIRTLGVAALAASWLLSPVTPAKSIQPSGGTRNKPDPETLLISIYKDLQASQLNEAQAKADALVEAYPNFRVGHLIRGDLLLMHTQPVLSFGGGVGANAPADKLKDLRDEARARLLALTARPSPELAPRSVLQLRSDQRNVLVVDAKQSRLYVYENRNGQLKFVTDYYISQGKLGINKLREGDQKTPVGVYYITGRVSGARLPDFYGASALRINYPNEWDRANDRSGSGIFLHGTPSDTYSRPPLASDGCVVLTNADLKKLEGSVDIGKTPVVIADQVEFISRSQWDAERALATQLMDAWRTDISSTNQARVLKHYSSKFKSGQGEDLKTWYERDLRALVDVVGLSTKLSDVTLFRYPGRDDMIVSTFTLETLIGKNRNSIRKRQYWSKEGTNWKIVHESLI
ncbi:L,D-transpeptidase family protein [Massilia endophytica]|uniref:L,D-transpeptidase family protein n=1 Tax=Massilia endophytica TaxID=2899220 RepID=UPI001E33772A|nr:L,D-transpeptidase family protein [Massilia endophytica]UGQ49088.1 L,D-transpeptidase family protein [Massilia endophytica]